MFGIEEKLEELEQLYKSGLIDKAEYRDLSAKAYIAYDKMPSNIQKMYNSQNTQRTQPQRTYSQQRTQTTHTRTAQRTQPQRTQNTQSQQKKGKGCISPFIIFIIISIVIGLLQDCN